MQQNIKKSNPTILIVCNSSDSSAAERIVNGFIVYNRTLKERWNLRFSWGTTTSFSAIWERCDAVLFASLEHDVLLKARERFPDKPIIGTFGLHEGVVPTVCNDDYLCGRMAADHLIKQGYHSFAFESRNDPSISARKRLQGYRDRIEAEGGVCTRVDELDGWNNPAGDVSWLLHLERPLGIFQNFDSQAIVTLMMLQRNGINVPHEAAVVSVNNDETICELCEPPLSSIDPNYFQVGYRSGERMEKLLEKTVDTQETICIPPLHVVVRESSNGIPVADPDVVAAISCIRANARRGYTVEDVVRSVPFSRRTLEVKFRKHLGKTVFAMLTEERIRFACYLLEYTQLTMDEIALRSGYSAPRFFYRAFRKAIGQTPGEFRRIARLDLRK